MWRYEKKRLLSCYKQEPFEVEAGPLRYDDWCNTAYFQHYRCANCERKSTRKLRLAAARDRKLYCYPCTFLLFGYGDWWTLNDAKVRRKRGPRQPKEVIEVPTHPRRYRKQKR